MKKILIYLFAPLLSIAILILITISLHNKSLPKSYEFSTKTDLKNYHSVIHKGRLEKTKNFTATVIKEAVNELLIPLSAEIHVFVGDTVPKNQLIYSTELTNISFDYSVIILAINMMEDAYKITYRRNDNDYIEFKTSKIDYYEIPIKATIRIKFNDTLAISQIESKENVNDEYNFTSTHIDLSAVTSVDVSVVVIIQAKNDVTYIEARALKNYLSNKHTLEICNIYANKNPQFYTKTITVEWFDGTYFIITSENVYSYEMVKVYI
ncbi:MAG: hypothetical protein LBF12_06980 [Christensenellaceae bacterium]|jgi:hypothetical protein|nr:hypothetical protein [Christensenellaceae bacterium]